MRPSPTALPLALVALALALSACSTDALPPDGAGSKTNALPPLASLPGDVAALPEAKGYVVVARKDLNAEELADALSAIAALPGVSTASQTRSRVSVELFDRASPQERDAILRQLAALGAVTTVAPTKAPSKAPTKAPATSPTKSTGRSTPAPAPAPERS